jgi:uncharacterized protein (DUF2384 family)
MRHKADRRDVFLVGLIEDYMKLYGLDDATVAKALGISEATWYRRKTRPGNFTLDEIAAVCKRLQIPREEMAGRLLR